MEKHDFDNIIANDPYAYAPRLSVTIGGIGYGSMVNINFCASCSYMGTAITMKKMLETQFPGIDVIIDNYPPPLPKRLFCKARVLLRFSAMVNRFSGEIELKDLVDKTLANSRVTDNLGVVWS
ncbi:hypothetical protein V6N11_044320 [Hibiscus sabdariffa]|uniref:Uncharacterized protein n=1 Tax=Hibiscus sabdariffa TaxID=183260 RepID=A0ABR2REU8_9ROSI